MQYASNDLTMSQRLKQSNEHSPPESQTTWQYQSYNPRHHILFLPHLACFSGPQFIHLFKPLPPPSFCASYLKLFKVYICSVIGFYVTFFFLVFYILRCYWGSVCEIYCIYMNYGSFICLLSLFIMRREDVWHAHYWTKKPSKEGNLATNTIYCFCLLLGFH